MSKWTTVTANNVSPGNRVRFGTFEFDVARIEHPFLGMDNMFCLIEDTPDRWHAYPLPSVQEVEVQTGG